MDFLIKALQLILSLSILVILHEFGHFFFARLFKTRVEKFYLFFNPWFSLFKYKRGDTEYGIGWLPLGGYVKISGMIDESMDKEQLAQPPQPHEFRSKPAWQRLLIMVGGVLVNFITALVIFWLILFKWGESSIPVENAKYGFYFHPVAHEIGLVDGDKILAIDSKPLESLQSIAERLILDKASLITVERADSVFDIIVPADFHERVISARVRGLADFCMPVMVDTVVPESNAKRAGLAKWDSIVGVNNISTPYFHQVVAELGNNKGSEVQLTLYRDGELHYLPVEVDETGAIGFGAVGPAELLGAERISYGFLEAFPAGIDKGTSILTSYVKQLPLIFTKAGAKQVGGFGTIGSLFPSKWSWADFWYTTAFLSLILAFMNILPIPALDGGHVLFLLYEIVARRKPSEKFMEHAQMAGMMILIGLLLFANGNDLYRFIFK
jgi:regulator of sigma E protease